MLEIPCSVIGEPQPQITWERRVGYVHVFTCIASSHLHIMMFCEFEELKIGPQESAYSRPQTHVRALRGLLGREYDENKPEILAEEAFAFYKGSRFHPQEEDS